MKRIKPTQNIKKAEFYISLPKVKENLSEIQRLSMLRIKTLRINENSNTDESIQDISNKSEDILSHFYTRMVCAQSLWSANWFVNQEALLFKRRLRELTDNELEEEFYHFFLHLSSLDNVNKLITDETIFLINNKEKIPFERSYKVHFKFIVDLLMNRKVELEKGYAKVDFLNYRSIMTNFFRKHLEKTMTQLNNYYVDNPDERIKRIYNKIFSFEEEVTESTINNVVKYLPPCIDSIIKKANQEKGLKYTDRQILVRFFKDAGVSIEECIKYLRNVFKVSKDIFDKQYLYSIRHNYGLEGKRANYKSYPCSKIINSFVDNACVSCPFKRKSNLKEYFIQHNLEIEELPELLKDDNYEKNCTLLLNKVTNAEHNEIINSPIEFYKIFKEKSKND